MLGLSRLRLGIYATLVVLAGLAYWRYSYVTHALATANDEKALAIQQRDQAKADYAAYKQAKDADAALNRSTSETVQKRNTGIERTRTDVRVQCRPASVPSATASSGTSAGADATPIDGGATAPLRDIGGALEDARIEALKNNSNYMGLQEWEKRRR